MPTLVLTFQGRVIREYAFLEAGMSIGRTTDNAIVIDNLAVSGHHARIERLGSDYVLSDLQSTNGTFVNDARVSTHNLADGDVITVGKHSIRFTLPQPAMEPETLEDAQPATMVLDTTRHKELLAKQEAAAPAAPKPAAKPQPVSAYTPVPGWISIAVLGAIVIGIIALV